MISLFPENITHMSVFVWLMHRINEEFKQHAILKGGMALSLLDSTRSTNDLDYLFIPYRSRNGLDKKLDKIFSEIPNAKIAKSFHSNSLRYMITINEVKVQVETSVDLDCDSFPITTNSLANRTGQLPQVIRIMKLEVALSHKLAAWNERRLYRDLYDTYFLFTKLKIKPDNKTLLQRLKKINSRLPKLRKVRTMSLGEFINELENESSKIDSKIVIKELSPIIDKSELISIDLKIIKTIYELCEELKR